MSAKILEKILFVDDDVNLLQAVKRRYRKKFNIVTASSAKEGLEMLASNQFAVVVSDLQMPEMNGIEFLAKVREEYPDVTRVMLTGNADLKAAIDAVNNGHIFRFCTKPCPVDVMINTLWSAIEQYRLVNAERELLEKTLLGSVKVLTDILALVNPIAFGRASRVTNYVKKITRKLALKDVWKFEIAAMLSQIGCVTLPGEALEKVYRNQELGEEEKKMYESHPVVGQDLISKIPRLDEVGQIIAYQEKLFNGAGKPENGVKGKEIPLGARILKIALDFDILVHNGMRPSLAFEEMKTLVFTLFLLAQSGDPDALSDQALQLARQKEFTKAEQLWQKALAASPRHFASLFNLGFLNFSRQRFPQAESYLRRAAQVKPDDFNTHYLLGATLVNL